MSNIIAVELLGGIRAVGADGVDCTPKSLKCRLLLAYLCVPAGVARARSHLAEVFWPDVPLEQSSKNLRTTLSELRRALGSDAIVDELGELSIKRGLVRTDISALNDETQHDNLVSLGEFLEGFEHDQEAFTLWLGTQRDQQRDICVAYGLRQAQAFQANKEHSLAKTMLLQTIAIEPYSEALHRTLIALYIAMGERGLALAQFRTCRDILRRELDVAPSPETVALADSISGQALHPQSEVSARAQDMPQPVVADTQTSPPTGLAVLPFANLGGDAEAASIVDGIAEDIITDLSKVPELHIAPRSASMQFRGSSAPPSEKADALNVRYVLEGSLRMRGTRLRLSVQLIDTAQNKQIWAERYDRDNADIFDIQIDLAEHVVAALRPHLQLPDLAHRVKRTTENFEAYHHYLRGRELMRGMTLRSIEAAREMFGRALALDPTYVKAMVGEAMAETSFVYHYNQAHKGYDKPMATLKRALELDPNLPEAWLAWGWLSATTDLASGEYVSHFERALELDPNFAEAHYFSGVVALTATGDVDHAARSYFKAWELDPGDMLTATSLCRALRTAGRADRLELVEQSTLAIAKRRIGQNPNDFEACYALAMLLGHRGEIAEARYWAEVAADIGKNDTRTAYFVAGIYVGLGDIATATTHFKHVLSNDPPPARITLFAKNPEFEIIRRDPEVQKLIEEGLRVAGAT